MSFETEWGSIYSDISILMRASSVSNMTSANALTSSVLPTPVGPTKINDVGLCFLVKPALVRLTAEATA